jgi:IclR family transcriptional regulator, pca regulon regulatory protein
LGDEEEEDRDEPRPFPILREARYSRSLERGLAILGCFTPEHPMLGIAELAERLGMSRPTTHRYVSTLVSLGYLEQDASRKYRLALGTIDLGAGLNAMGLCTHARPHLEELSQRSGYTAEIAVLDGLEILLLDRMGGKHTGRNRPYQESVRAGSRLPAYCTSMGKVLLAYLPRGLREKLISEMDLTKRGPRTITSKAALSGQLEDVANEGLAINDEELLEGACAIAAPVREESGDVIAAVGLVAYGGLVDAEELVDQYEGKLVSTAGRVSRRVGWRGGEG